MMIRFLSYAAAVAALCVALPAYAGADIAKPEDASSGARADRVTRENTLRLVIESGDNAEAQIWLPPSLHAAIPSNATTVGGLPPLQTAAAGVALSLSLAFGGLWLARSRRRLGGRATAAVVAIVAALASTAVLAFANAAPPRHYQPVDPGTLGLAAPNGEPLAGTVRYYYGYDEGIVRIVLPRKR